jgi:hypothetical protein
MFARTYDFDEAIKKCIEQQQDAATATLMDYFMPRTRRERIINLKGCSGGVGCYGVAVMRGAWNEETDSLEFWFGELDEHGLFVPKRHAICSQPSPTRIEWFVRWNDRVKVSLALQVDTVDSTHYTWSWVMFRKGMQTLARYLHTDCSQSIHSLTKL